MNVAQWNPFARSNFECFFCFFSFSLLRCVGIGGGDSEDGDSKEKDEEAERERLEAIREAEDRRKEKHRKMEEEREKMRQDIRDKVFRFGFHSFDKKKRNRVPPTVLICAEVNLASLT